MTSALMLPLIPQAEHKTETNKKRGTRGPRSRYLPAIKQILNEQLGQMTDRQIFYRLVSKGIIPNSVCPYDQVCGVLKRSRVDGSIPWERIVDRSKPVYEINERDCGPWEDYFESQKEEYENAGEIFREAADEYYVPLWTFQREYVEVWCEKDALAGVLEQVTRRYAIPLVVCRGYQSITTIHDRLRIYGHQERDEEREITVLYFGDYDPRGENIPDVISRDFQSLGYDLHLEKIALTDAQIKRYSLIPAPCKKRDTMARSWISTHGDAVFELDALEPDALLQIVEDSVKAHWSQEAGQKREEYVRTGRQELAKLISKYFGEDSHG